jgi:hypothetical protein
MAAILTRDVLNDDIAMNVARAVAAANKRARKSGVDVLQSLITITQVFDSDVYWRITYGPKEYIGKRGGDLIIEVDLYHARIQRVLHGQ